MPRRLRIPPGPNALAAYYERLSERTCSFRVHDLGNWSGFTIERGLGEGLPKDVVARTALFRYEGATWGFVASPDIAVQYRDWMAERGETVETINRRLSTLRIHIQLVHANGHVSDAVLRGIMQTHDISLSHAIEFDRARPITRLQERHVPELTSDQVACLKQQPNTPQGQRDLFMICGFTDHGLLRKQMADIRHEDIDIEQHELYIRHPMATEPRVIMLSEDTYGALMAYLEHVPRREGMLLMGSLVNGQLKGAMSENAILKRISRLGDKVGISNLSPLDLRNYWMCHQGRG